MSGLFPTIPPPKDDDHEDVAWALRAASAQWKRSSREDALHWVRRAAETAEEVGDAGRFIELSQLANALERETARIQSAPPVFGQNQSSDSEGAPSIQIEEVEVDFEVDDDDDGVEMLDDDDEIVILDDEEVGVDSQELEEIEDLEELEELIDPDEVSSTRAQQARPSVPSPSVPAPSMPSPSVPAPSMPPRSSSARSSSGRSSSPKSSSSSRSAASNRSASERSKTSTRATSRPSARASSSTHRSPSRSRSSSSPQRPASSLKQATRSTTSRAEGAQSSIRPPLGSSSAGGSQSSSRPSSSRPSTSRPSASRPSASLRPSVSGSRSETGSTRSSRPSPKLDRIPPSMRPEPSGLDLADMSPDSTEEFGELHFDDEARTNRVKSSHPPSQPSAPDLGPLSMDGTKDIPFDEATAAEFAQGSSKERDSKDHEELERQLGVDLSVPHLIPPHRSPGKGRAEPASRSPVASWSPADDRAPLSPSSYPPGAILSGRPAKEASQEDSVPGRASVRASRPPASGTAEKDREIGAASEPYGLAPSASLPAAEIIPSLLERTESTETSLQTEAPIEPPSQPQHAPPPDLMADPTVRTPTRPVDATPTFDSLPVAPPPDVSPLSSAPDMEEFEDMFDKLSMPAVVPTSAASASVDSGTFGLAEKNQSQVGRDAPEPPDLVLPPTSDEDVAIDGVDFLDIPGLQDLPPDSARTLAESAAVRPLALGEGISEFGAVLVTRGSVRIVPEGSTAACYSAEKGAILYTSGTVEPAAPFAVTGVDGEARVAVFAEDQLSRAVSACPWVVDELEEVADGYLAYVGAVSGALGERLDPMFLSMVLDKCSVRSKSAGEMFVEAGDPLDGLYVLGGGSLEVLAEDGSIASLLAMGDIVFPPSVLSAAPAPHSVRAGPGGALLLFADRMAAHELLATCPPVIELLAGM